MMVSIDRAGRIVVPKDVRDLLGLQAGAELALEVVGDGIRITPARPARGGWWRSTGGRSSRLDPAA